jgi:hypothetical protein
MTSRASHAAVRSWTSLAYLPLRALSRACLIMLMAIAGTLGAPPPTFLRHEDAVAMVASEEVDRE